MPLIKIGKDYYNGRSSDLYLMQGKAMRDAEIKTERGPAKVSIAAATSEDGSTLFVNLNGWRDRKNEVAGIKKFDSVLAVGALSQREYNGTTHIDMDADFVAISGAGIGAAILDPDAAAPGGASFLDDLEDAGELPFL